MPRRPPAEGTAANRILLAVVILLLPWLIDAQQQQQNAGRDVGDQYKSPREAIKADPIATLEATTLGNKAQRHESPLNAGRAKSTPGANKQNLENNGNDASAIAAFAPAESAVRAPSTGRSSIENNAGLSPQSARSLEDWGVEDFVLLATVDGKLYARDRKTGTQRWALDVDRPVVQTTYHERNGTGQDGEEHQPVDDYLWIVEPSADGSLFVYIPGGPQPGLVNTGLTMKKLVEEMVPYADTEPAVVYTGDKVTSLWTIDARNGAVLKWFGSAGSFSPGEATCDRPDEFQDPDGEECSTRGTLTLGRTEYTVGIQGKDGHPIVTLKYAEWGPNNYDQDLLRQHRSTLDGKYMYSSHDGGVFAYDLTRSKDRGALYNARLPSPVIRVFDVARPLDADTKNPELIILPQPVPPLVDDSHESIRHARIFVNQTEAGDWFAMSGNSYPLVIDGPEQAQCDTANWLERARFHEPVNNAQLQKALVGLHSIDGRRHETLLTISGPTDQDALDILQSENDTIHRDAVANTTSPAIGPKPSVLHHVRQLPTTAVTSIIELVNNPITTLLLLTLLFWYNRDIARWIKSTCNKYINIIAKLTGKLEEDEDVDDFSNIDAPLKQDAPAPEPLPQVATVGASDSSDDTAPTPTKKQDGKVADVANEARREPLGEVAVNDGSRPPKQPKPEGKKAHRGKRGGLKHKKGQRQPPSSDGPIPSSPATVEDAVRDAKMLGGSTRIEPDVETLPNGVNEISGPILRMNSLDVNMDKLIGTGSNGTMVFEGKFDGRDVAVKRMLIQFFEIASQETKLLRESDDHPNVIRYYAQQQSQGFLYIALELCSASLADVIEKPQLHRDLAQSGERDLPNVLYQITNGLQHLHNLRIVHRDLKPQNILVSMGKDGRPRLLVSDFGLCKKLEGEQSSFRATTAHAAGTSGWRAPELLLDDDLREGSVTAMESTLSSSHSTSGIPLVSSDLMPNRRATRAIDIFSLGLVFFYVLTKGSHPFDCGDRYMREVNIRKGEYKLSPLDVLGDYAFEATDLIRSMLEQLPKARPTAKQVMSHPFFWSPKKRLNFLCDVSDHFEKEKRDPPSDALIELERWAPEITRGDFLKPLGKEFTDSLGKQRKYTGARLLDLLRALRNKKNHYEDMSDKLKKDVGPLPEGYLSFWTRKFPNLLIGCWNVVYEVRWDEVDRFREYYQPAGL
ncbi:bifunctional endoribonuclease/protein kinase ire1 [Pseudogymnoascus australis]